MLAPHIVVATDSSKLLYVPHRLVITHGAYLGHAMLRDLDEWLGLDILFIGPSVGLRAELS